MAVPQSPLVLVVVGPTAVGKTEVALEVAERLGGEIISADSRQVYREFDIGTAKPTPQERARVPHHLVDFLDPRATYSVAEFCAAAKDLVERLWNEGKVPLVVGGTGLYVRGFMEGWTFGGVPAEPSLRAHLEERAQREGIEALWEELHRLDPETAQRLSRQDRKRIVRALEVCLLTGQPLSRFLREQGRRPPSFRFLPFALTLPRPLLYQRINRRVLRMLEAGWLEEVKRLAARGYDERTPAMESVGYRPLLRAVRGEISLDEAIPEIQRETRRYAKRQLTWFRAQPGLRWIDRSQEEPVGLLVEAFREALGEA